jgi:hypothetical protein
VKEHSYILEALVRLLSMDVDTYTNIMKLLGTLEIDQSDNLRVINFAISKWRKVHDHAAFSTEANLFRHSASFSDSNKATQLGAEGFAAQYFAVFLVACFVEFFFFLFFEYIR